MIENGRQLIAARGPFFDHWRRQCAAAFGVTPVDELESSD